MLLRFFAFSMFVVSASVFADVLLIPNTLSNNTTADADDVQANFDVIAAESNENDLRIEQLEGYIARDAGNNVTVIASLPFLTTGSPFPVAGTANTAVGVGALQNTTSGYENVAVGPFTLSENSTGVANTATGGFVLQRNTTGSYNAAAGYAALLFNDTGSNNTAMGAFTLSDNTSGQSNTALGYAALDQSTTASYNTSSGGFSMQNTTTGNQNTASGYAALNLNSTGSGNVAVGRSALASNQTGSFNTAIGHLSDVTTDSLENATAVGYDTKVDASNKIRLGNADVTVIEGQVPYTSTSDARLKESIVSIDTGLSMINDLHPVAYHRINNDENDIEMGLLAQEVAAVLKAHGLGNSGMVHRSSDTTMSLRYNDLLAPMIRAIQELDSLRSRNSAQIALLEERLARQQAEMLAIMQSQQEQIARLEAMTAQDTVAAR